MDNDRGRIEYEESYIGQINRKMNYFDELEKNIEFNKEGPVLTFKQIYNQKFKFIKEIIKTLLLHKDSQSIIENILLVYENKTIIECRSTSLLNIIDKIDSIKKELENFKSII